MTRTPRAPAYHGICWRAVRTSHGCMRGKQLGLRGRRDPQTLKGTVQPWFTKTDDEPTSLTVLETRISLGLVGCPLIVYTDLDTSFCKIFGIGSLSLTSF